MVPLAARAKTTAARGPALPHEPRRAGGSRSAPMAHGERELQVRALDGRSAAVTLAAAAAASVVDLKAVLRSSFPPAQISHNFHLFLKDRRKIEGDLFEGKLRGVAATNALELGIDVGHIDATLHLGFPGSVARPIEHCHVDSHNPKIFEQHLACAAYEHPICLQYDEDHFGSSLDSIMTTLKMKGYLINNPSGPFSSTMWNYIGPEKRPSQTVSIRAIQHDKYSVIDKLNNRLLEEIEESKAFSRWINHGFTISAS
ncbi:hypothetical protein ACQ4PT_061888 [Festuca glaucescens]